MKTEALRLPLLGNAAFSLATGVAMLLAAPLIAGALGPPIEELYLLLGAGLVLFSVTLCVIALRPAPLIVLAVSLADATWIIATIAALLIWPSAFTPLGFAVVLAVNAVVAVIAWAQLGSILSAFRASDAAPGEYEVCIAAAAPVDAEAFWRVLADLGAIHRYAASLKSSALTVGDRPGPGAVRTCEDLKGQTWSERCDSWDEGKAFSVTFLADEPSFPYPFSKMRGGWRVEPLVSGCRVEVWWRVVPRQAWAAPLLLPVMAAGARASFGDVIARMALAATGAAPEAMPTARLAPLRVAAC